MATDTLTRQQAPRRRKRQYEWTKSFLGDVLAFLVGSGVCVVFKLIGDIPLSEVILVPFVPLLLAVNGHRLNLRRRILGVILTLGLLWLFGNIVTDVYRSIVFLDRIKGIAAITFFMLNIIGLTILLKGNVHRQLVFLFGLGIGNALIPTLQPGYTGLGSFKFAYAWAIMYLASLASIYFYKRRQYLAVGFLFLLCIGANLVFDYRSVILTLFVSICLVLPVIPERIGRLRILPPDRTQARVYTIIGIALVAGAVAGKVMTVLASSGALGPSAQEKNREQTVAGWGLLIGGRPEILVSSRAVMDSPILGHGYRAVDPKYIEMLGRIEVEYGMRASDEGEKFGGIIPAHSHLMGAWVSEGILGAVFWIYILSLNLKAIVKSALLKLPTAPAYTLILVKMTWDILFSPFGSTVRIVEAFFIVIICDLLDPDSKISNTVAPVYKRAQVQMQTRNLGRVPKRLSGNF
jgi:hypothetical protein